MAEPTMRLPGSHFMGHANVWLFRLASINENSNYSKLFQILQEHHLAAREYESKLIAELEKSNQRRLNDLDSIKVLSNDAWIRQNTAKVDEFRQRRWPLYPFETKFEIMKLISKHVFTVHDLIVDEQMNNILQQCSTKTFVACASKWTNDITYSHAPFS